MSYTKEKIVKFYKYCNKCTRCAADESDEICNECLSRPVNENSHRPIHFNPVASFVPEKTKGKGMKKHTHNKRPELKKRPFSKKHHRNTEWE